ncbi:MAG TPA: hypothetical protein VGJ94_10235 [Syntrophorhabdaceae bacterium]|jgi:hypothetical protein
MYIEVGPASIVVTGEKEGGNFDFDEEEIKNLLGRILLDVGASLPVLKQKGYRIMNPDRMPRVARKMVAAVQAIDGRSLTPMAAVAGAVADALREALSSKGLDFIMVNNGGDISFYNAQRKTIRAGVRDIMGGAEVPHILEIEGIMECGLATSGFGGRSFTLGLADMATVLAVNAAVADAAATSICNAVNVESDKVVRRKAAEIDPSSDIADEWITVKRGILDESLVKRALEKGLAWAQALKDRQSILDAVIRLGNHSVATSGGKKYISIRR